MHKYDNIKREDLTLIGYIPRYEKPSVDVFGIDDYGWALIGFYGQDDVYLVKFKDSPLGKYCILGDIAETVFLENLKEV